MIPPTPAAPAPSPVVIRRPSPVGTTSPLVLARPLAYAAFERVERDFAARSIAELLHERLLDAEVTELEPDGEPRVRLRLVAPPSRDGGDAVAWTCVARRRALDFFHVEPETVERRVGGEPAWLGAAALFVDFKDRVGIAPFTLARFIEETAQTLYADAVARDRGRPRAADLARADHQAVEAAMEGHPWILVNKGRLGFGAAELQAYAPEAGPVFPLVWLAVRRDLATYHGEDGVDHDGFYRREFGDELDELRAALAAVGRDAGEYLFVPVHPWQFARVIAVQFAREIARGVIVPLGPTRDAYHPQQSIRTFRAEGRPERAYVKTALSILNTGQIRGLAPHKLARAPRVTAWLRSTLGEDPSLRAMGTILLGEVATIACEPPAYARVDGAPYQYRETLGVLFRESPEPFLEPGETLATMASLLYVDDDGTPLVAELARRAGVDLGAWLGRYLDAYLVPLLHCMFRHETFFVAHGENTILVLRDGLPTRVVLKDLVEEVQVSRAARARVPEDLRGIFYEIDDALVPLFVLTDVVDGFFRYLGDVLATHAGFPEARFWGLVRRTVVAYQDAHPELAEAFARFDLFPATFPRFCLNKYRLVHFGYADASDNALDDDPKFDGVLPNPLAAPPRDGGAR